MCRVVSLLNSISKLMSIIPLCSMLLIRSFYCWFLLPECVAKYEPIILYVCHIIKIVMTIVKILGKHHSFIALGVATVAAK